MRRVVRQIWSFPLLLVLFGGLGLPLEAGAQSQNEKSIAFLPFAVHASQELSYLREGIREMLASRLAAGAGARVVSQAAVEQQLTAAGPPSSPEQFQALGRQVGADYLVTGSFTSLGGGVSLDAQVYPTAGEAAPQRFYASAPRQEEVITAIDQLAWNISSTLFGAAKPTPRNQQPKSSPEQANSAAPPASFQTAHPDRVFMQAAPAGASPDSDSVLIRPQAATSRQGFTKSQNFDRGLDAMDVGDVTGDGQDEIVLAQGSMVYVYRPAGNRLQELGQYSVADRHRVHWLSLADLNGNGRQEIYISAADAERPASTAVEWGQNGFEPLFTEARWYLRAMEVPDQGPLLLGQRGGVETTLLPGIYALTVESGKVEQDYQLPLPEQVNLFSFALGDLDGDNTYEIVAVDEHDRLRVLSRSGKVRWQSDDRFAGTGRYLGGEPILGAHKESSRYESETANVEGTRVYLPSRIMVRDLDRDGRAEVVVNQNPASATTLFRNVKSYPSGAIYGLAWNGLGLAELWHTRKIDGSIINYQLRQNENQPALLYVGLELDGGILGGLTGKESTVLTYRLNLQEQTSAPE